MILYWVTRQSELNALVNALFNSGVNPKILPCTLVSRQFRKITEPLIYREVKIKAQRPYTAASYSFPQLRHFARAIALRPELSALVQKFDASSLAITERTGEPPEVIDGTVWCNRSYSLEDVEVYLERRSDEVRADKRVLLDAITRLGLPNGLIVEGNSIGEFLLLLHLLPRLKELQLKMSDDMAVIAIASLGAFGGKVPTGMQSISKLSIVHEGVEVTYIIMIRPVESHVY